MDRQMPFKPDRDKKRKVPSVRQLRRTCNKELYRTAKRLNIWIPPEKKAEAEKRYLKKVVYNIQWIVENGNNRKKLADWWAEEVAPDISELWEVDRERLVKAFRQAFGG